MLDEDFLKANDGTRYYRFARNIKIASGGDYDDIRHTNMAGILRQTAEAVSTLMRYNWTGYGIVSEISLTTGKEVIITPHAGSSCNAMCNGTPTWDKTGRQVQVTYTPYIWGNGRKCPGVSATPDAVLLHELCHAYRHLKGKRSSTSVAVLGFHYDNFEEFFAILLTNIYLSKRGETNLRKDHWGFEVLDKNLANSEGFFKIFKHIELVRQIVREEYNLCSEFIKQEDCAFNPIRYYLSNAAALDAKIAPKPYTYKRDVGDDELEKRILEHEEERRLQEEHLKRLQEEMKRKPLQNRKK